MTMCITMSNSGAEEEPPQKKKLKLSSPSPYGSSSLPDEIILTCLARVSRLGHDSLSLVSKWHRSLLVSPEFHHLRSLMGCPENLIYLCLRIPPEPNPRWFTFSPKTLNRPRRLIPIRSYFYQPPEVSAVVAVGSGIYVIGGRIGGRRSRSVLFLDCRSHKWSTVPPMAVARASAAAAVVDGKIYVLGGSGLPNSTRWGEVFDPKTQTWEIIQKPPDENNLRRTTMYESAAIGGKVFAVNMSGSSLFYTPSEGIWKRGILDTGGKKRGWYVIENVMYCCVKVGKILWCEAEELEWREPGVMEWREVMGLEGLRDTLCASKLVNYGGLMSDYWESRKMELVTQGLPTKELDDILPGHKLSNSGPNMLIFWDVLAPGKYEVWCAEISLERRKEKSEIWGKIEWSEAVMTLDPPPPHQQHSIELWAS